MSHYRSSGGGREAHDGLPLPDTDLTFDTPLASFGKLWGIDLDDGDHANDRSEDSPEEPASVTKPATALAGRAGSSDYRRPSSPAR